jgi:fibronectin type 3 domain-containing protein
MRSTDQEGNYQTIQNIAYQDSLVRFSVTENETGDHYYYKLALSNKDDSVFSVQRYLFTLDQKPPNPPVELKGRIDSSGIVTLQWEAPEDKDIKGYRVFRANQKSEEFIEITSQFVTKTNFIDTLALDNLTSEVFYCMRATDLNYNQSTMSDTILILKPDTIPPIPCVLVDVLAQDSLLKISWVNSDSKDLENNFLVRMNNESTDTLFNWKNTASSYEDYDILPGTNYVYTIVSIDKSANSASSRVFARFYEPGYRNPLMNFKAISDKENKLVNLSWEKPKDKIYSYQIFRSKEGEKLRQLKTITDSSIISFTDKNVRINNKYNYSIKYVNQDGIHSIPAKAVVVYP